MPLPTHLFWEAPAKASQFILLAPQGRYHAFGVFIKTNVKWAQTTPLYHWPGFRQPKWLPRVFSKCFHLQQPPFSLNLTCSNILYWLAMLLLSPKPHAMSCMFKSLEAIFSMFLTSSRERRRPWFCSVSRCKLKFISKGAMWYCSYLVFCMWISSFDKKQMSQTHLNRRAKSKVVMMEAQQITSEIPKNHPSPDELLPGVLSHSH